MVVLREVQPKVIYVSADGPASESEVERCRQARESIEAIDWPCEVHTRLLDENRGGPYACSSAINWAFEQVTRLIILEDDCLPNPEFFSFCEQMLERYSDEPRVMHVAGSNFIPEKTRNKESYHFSRYTPVWGWATWRRAWEHFDLDLSDWPVQRRNGLLEKCFHTRSERKYWTYFFDRVHRKISVHWDYAWQYTCLAHNGLAVVPNCNLVSNIGFGEEATHTINSSQYIASLPRETMQIEAIEHPASLVVDEYADALTFHSRFAEDKRMPLKRTLEKIRLSAKALVHSFAGRLSPKKKKRLYAVANGIYSSLNFQFGRMQRLLARPPLPKNPNGEIYVHLGCGTINHPSFVNVDMIPRAHVHYLSPIDDLPMFADQTVDLIYACHCIEHLSYRAMTDVFGEWKRILKIGGRVRISVPDFDLLLKIYEENGRDITRIQAPLLGGQGYAYNHHYSVFNEKYLTALLLQFGFVDVRRWEPGSSKLTNMNDWSGKRLRVGEREYPVSLNLEARRGV